MKSNVFSFLLFGRSLLSDFLLYDTPGATRRPFWPSKVDCFFRTFHSGPLFLMRRYRGSCGSQRSSVCPSTLRTILIEKRRWFRNSLLFPLFFLRNRIWLIPLFLQHISYTTGVQPTDQISFISGRSPWELDPDSLRSLISELSRPRRLRGHISGFRTPSADPHPDSLRSLISELSRPRRLRGHILGFRDAFRYRPFGCFPIYMLEPICPDLVDLVQTIPSNAYLHRGSDYESV